MPMQDSIYGLFPGPAAAQRGMDSLRQAGVAHDRIVVMSAQPYDEYEFTRIERNTSMYKIAALGGIVGGSLGFWLAWYMQTAYPFPLITGGMPLVAPWPTGIVTYELTMLSAIITTVVTLLVTTGLPNWRKTKIYDEEVSSGMVLIGVADPTEAARADLESRLTRAGAQKIKGTGRFARS
ncbi:MAG TPA: quinol:electron acceptor oxidoreductase subunit ActD [Candidatus Acidoferrales bacterium]